MKTLPGPRFSHFYFIFLCRVKYQLQLIHTVPCPPIQVSVHILLLCKSNSEDGRSLDAQWVPLEPRTWVLARQKIAVVQMCLFSP